MTTDDPLDRLRRERRTALVYWMVFAIIALLVQFSGTYARPLFQPGATQPIVTDQRP